MSQPYPDPPISTPFLSKNDVVESVWSKWFQGLRVIVNRLSGGLNVNGTIPLAPVTISGTVGSIVIANGVVTKIVLPT